MSTVPVIDIAPAGGSVSAARRVAGEVDRACRDVGFFGIRGHGVERGLRAEVLYQARRFFALPDAAKQEIHIARSSNNRGYAQVAGEQLQPDRPGDLKESFDIGLERPADDPLNSPLEGPNQWPDLPGFRKALTAYQNAALGVSERVLALVARGLGADPDYFAELMHRPLVNSRILRYPSSAERTAAAQLGCGAHSDYGALTLLFDDGIPGLQLRSADDTWLDVEVPADVLLVNLGDLLQMWTNDEYRSTQHRVLSAEQERYSVPVFVNPGWNVEVATLANCVSDANPLRYPPVLAGEYLQGRFDDTFAYRTA